eukprot:TRINITY_DN2015_c0_g1_i1.p1 TRINITY_DN2015_c0_g1~~TRINITY_DN2015_c0_g1_i1.p1  ORF type:complete len:139 (-),score=58.02 TRINITY_DN2015_c0_g1_i1:160-576(-)
MSQQQEKTKEQKQKEFEESYDLKSFARERPRSISDAFRTDPFIMIGGITTAGVLMAGIWAMYNQKQNMSQWMMRLRVIAQGATVALVAVSGYSMQKKYDLAMTNEQKKAQRAYKTEMPTPSSSSGSTVKPPFQPTPRN